MAIPSRDAAEVAALATDEVLEEATELARQMASLAANFVLRAGEIDRRKAWRIHGSTSLESWMVDRLGFAYPTAKAYATLAGRLSALPVLARTLTAGDLSFDKARAVAEMATPENERELTEQARDLTVREQRALALSKHKPNPQDERQAHGRRSVRFNDTFRTVTAQLPLTSYAEVRAILEEEAKRIHSDGETRWDQRLADALMGVIRGSGQVRGHAGGSAHTVVAHAPLRALTDPDSTLCGELERAGLISAEVVREVLCDATVIVAGDDQAGHTMYEGRGRRFATETQRRELWRRDRHCRFPGCDHALFVIAHHLESWQSGGTTDLPNLALLCEHHHHLVHSKAWELSGDGNAELRFVGPSGDVMTSKPSPRWALVTDPATSPDRDQPRTEKGQPTDSHSNSTNTVSVRTRVRGGSEPSSVSGHGTARPPPDPP